MPKRNRELYQSDPSYMAALYELQRRSKSGLLLHYYDCEDIGNKNTECTHGLCDNTIQQRQDGIYPGPAHVCPHDSRYFEKDGTPTVANREVSHSMTGCFYSCHVFQKRSVQHEVISKRIDAAIKQAEEKYDGHFITDEAEQ